MKIVFTSFMLLLFAWAFSGCANIIPPEGGPRDTLAPVQVAAFPKDSATNFSSKKITITFNEYVEAKEVQQNLLMNPVPKNLPAIDYKLKNVFITLRDSLEPNTTYSINFGNAIKDVNEGNIVRNKTYVFSTGKYIDSCSISGKVILAQDGKVDSTLLVILHNNLADSSVKKNRPRYIAKLNNEGVFQFKNLPATDFNVFVVPNDYSKKYDDTTKLFAFLNKKITAALQPEKITLFAYRQTLPLVKPNAAGSKGDEKGKEDKKLRYQANLYGGRFDILDSAFVLSFNKKIVFKNSDSIQLLDTNYKPVSNYSIAIDSNNLLIKNKFTLNTKYILILNKNSVSDTGGVFITRNDTIKFSSYAEGDYGSIKLRLNGIAKSGVLQFFKDDKLQAAYPINSKEIREKLFKPGEYELRILLDENGNGVWDAGNYRTKLQPEKVILIATKLLVKPNWDNEMDISW